MNPNQSPSLSRPRDRYDIYDDITAQFHRACARLDHREVIRLENLLARISVQLRYTRLANRLSPR